MEDKIFESLGSAEVWFRADGSNDELPCSSKQPKNMVVQGGMGCRVLRACRFYCSLPTFLLLRLDAGLVIKASLIA